LTVIPKLGMGILESNGLMDAAELDKFMNTILRSVCWPIYIRNLSNPPPH
jgi:hypothetical protein